MIQLGNAYLIFTHVSATLGKMRAGTWRIHQNKKEENVTRPESGIEF